MLVKGPNRSRCLPNRSRSQARLREVLMGKPQDPLTSSPGAGGQGPGAGGWQGCSPVSTGALCLGSLYH